eukprot:Clim_evm42s119 gene=Clim_evmTU42s119
MPILLVCGRPGSGKSTVVEKVQQKIKESGKKVTVVSESYPAGETKNTIYTDSQKEKPVRALLKAEVERQVSTKQTVIIDSLNYIKGYRYELWCIARAARTTYAVIHCMCPPEQVLSWNEKRREADQWELSVLEGLQQRFEEPISGQRWDSPLIGIVTDTEEVLLDQIEAALFSSQPHKPNSATQRAVRAPENFVHDAEKITQDITAEITSAQSGGMFVSRIVVPHCDIPVELSRPLTPADLRRLRRQFLNFTKTSATIHARGNDSINLSIGHNFVEFLNRSLADT